MKKILKKFAREESGQAMVLFALMLSVLLGFGALVVDGGMLYLAKAQMQNAADASALAGVQYLPSASAAKEAAKSYAVLNGVETAGVSVVTPYAGNPTEIEVVCKKTVEYTLARVLGLTSKEVSASAVAKISTAGGDIFNYAVFAGEGTVTMNGSGQIVGGNVYGRDGVYLGNKTLVTGNVVSTTGGLINIGINSTVQGAIIPRSPALPMPDFSNQIKQQAIVVNNQAEFDAVVTGKTLAGPIYVNGSVTINGRIRGNGIIYASGTISFKDDTILQDYSDSILFYAATGNMTFNGGSGVNVGILYAPNGTITINGATDSVTNGRLIAKKVDINGSKASVYSKVSDLNSLNSMKVYRLIK